MIKIGLSSLTLIFMLTYQSAFSAEIKNNTDEVISFEGYHQLGQARFSILFFDIYRSRLFIKNERFNQNSKPYIFEITYLKDITNKDLVERTIEQWQHLSVDKMRYQQYIPKLLTLWPNITASDKLALLVHDKKSVFYYNNRFLGEISDSEFGDLFLDIWLSPQTSQPKLRQQLLGIQ